MFQRILVAVVVAAGGFTTSAEAQKWHNVKIKFLYDGTAPTPKPENVNKDVQFCGKSGPTGEVAAGGVLEWKSDHSVARGRGGRSAG